MPAPQKSDPLLLFRLEQLESDHISKTEHNLQLQGIQESIDSLRDEVKEFKRSILSALKWIGGLFVGAILSGIISIIVGYITHFF